VSLGTDLPEGAAPDSENYLDTWLGKEAETEIERGECTSVEDFARESEKWA
jgi:hypothetical protein